MPTDAGLDAGVDAGPVVLPVDAGPEDGGPSLPAGATLIDEATYRQLESSGYSHPANETQAQADLTAAQAIDAANRREVDDYLTENANFLVLEPWKAMLLASSEAGEDLSVQGESDTISVHTMGRSFAYGAAASAIRGTKSRANQLSIYKSIVDGLPPNMVAQYGITPSSEAEYFTLAQLKDANERISAYRDTIELVFKPAFRLIQPLRGCETDVGGGKLFDHYGLGSHTKVDNATFSTTGLIARFDFPLRDAVSCVKNQGVRGTCWSFAAISMMEASESLKRGARVNYSEQDLINRAKLSWWPSLFEEGQSDVIGRMISEHYEPVYENAWSYNPSPSRITYKAAQSYQHSCDGFSEDCSENAHQGRFVCFQNGSPWCQFVGHSNPNTTHAPRVFTEVFNPTQPSQGIALAAIALSMSKQVEFAFLVFPEFDMAGANAGWMGVGPPRLPNVVSRGAHIAHVVTYVSNEALARVLPNATPAAGGGYFVLKNSWGATVGDAGYWYMPADYMRTSGLSIQILHEIE